MVARLRGFLVLVVGAVTMAFFFFVSIPAMVATGSGELPIWFGRRAWSRLGLWLAGARVEVARMPPVPPGPVIFVSNHESALDIWVLFATLGRSFRFMAKQELFRIPVFGWYLRMGGHIPVDRSSPSRSFASLRRAGASVRAGTSLVVFPEGTRSADGRIHAFKPGSFVVAKEAGVPIVPVAISGSGAITPTKVIAVHPGTIRVAAGDPIDPNAFAERDALLAEVRRRIVDLHRSIGGLGEDAGGATPPGGAAGAGASGAPARSM
jgi:1-acyl-sn-glycerol-3-phosphate acyltransferase